MGNRDIVAIGTSAGGVEALLKLAGGFRTDFPASILVTIHLPSWSKSSLDQLLSAAGPLQAKFAEDGDPLRKARIYIAPPDRHLLVEGDRLELGIGPRENNSRPAIDTMLRSAAVCCCARTIGVVLTGTLGDGASGLWAIKNCGGVTVVQDPSGAAFPEMPRNALDRAKPDHIVHLEQMQLLLDSLVHQPAGEPCVAPEHLRYEVEVAKGKDGNVTDMDRIGRRSVLSCPDCQGVMWEIDEGDLIRFRCHVGHTYIADLMSLALDENLRRALASAQRALEERVALARKLHLEAKNQGHKHLMHTWSAKAQEFEQELAIIRDSIHRMNSIAANKELLFSK